MRLLTRVLGPALALATLLGVAGCGGGTTPVPSNVQQAVHHDYGSLGFIPTRVSYGYAFQEWTAEGAAGFNMYFSSGSGEQLQFGVVTASCESMGRAMHAFEEDRVAVEWSATEEDQQAWRCVTVNGTHVVVMASRSVSGDDALVTSQQRKDAEQLVDLVAHSQVAQ